MMKKQLESWYSFYAFVTISRHYVFGLSVCVCAFQESLLAWHIVNCMEEFHQIHNFSILGDKYKLIRF